MLRSVSIKARVRVLVVAILLFMLAMIAAGVRGIDTISRHERVLTACSALSGDLHQMLRGLAETIVIPDTPETVATAREGMEQVKAELERLRQLVQDRQIRQDIERDIAPLVAQVRAEGEALLARGRLDPDDVEAMVAFGRLTARNATLLAAVRALTERSASVSERAILRVKAELGAIALLAVAASSAFFLLLYRSVVRPLRQLSSAAHDVTRGDLSATFAADREDEMGVLAASLSVMTRSLADTIRRTGEIHRGIAHATRTAASTTRDVATSVEHQKASVGQTVRAVDDLQRSYASVAESAGKLSAAAEASSGASEELLGSITEVSRNAAAFHGRASETVAEVKQVMEASGALARSIEQLRAYSDSTSESIRGFGASVLEIETHAREAAQLSRAVTAESQGPALEAVRHALDGMRRIEESVNGLAETVQRLGARSGDIAKILLVIEDITNQTELLALNAAILAAQAGENGRGFAIVAKEIRGLADRTSESTQEIAEVVAEVRQESAESVARASRGMDAVSDGKLLVTRVHDALLRIDGSAERSALKAADILRGTSAEVRVVGRMAQAVDELSEQVRGIARAAEVQQQAGARVQSALEEFIAISLQIRTATREQEAAGGEITRAAIQVATQASHISSAVGDQRERSREMLRAAQALDEKASELISVSGRMAEAIAPLSVQSDALAAEMKRFSIQ
jgi:methyl-accepting chemotaxis protein